MFSIRFNRWTVVAFAFTALAVPGPLGAQTPGHPADNSAQFPNSRDLKSLTMSGSYLAARHASVERDARHPCQILAGKDEWPLVSFFAWHACVNKDVLQLARPTAAHRSQAEARQPVPHAQLQPGAKMRRPRVIAARAVRDLELRGYLPVAVTDDLHMATHDTETHAAR